MSPAAFDGVLFDWGETLFYNRDGAELLVEAGLPPVEAARLWSDIWTASKSPTALARHRDVSAANHRAAWASLLEPAEAAVPGMAEMLYERVVAADAWLPYPDTVAVLRSIHDAEVAAGIVSNVPSALGPVLERHGLGGLVDAVVESYCHGVEKPDPALFLLACRELGTAPGRTLMVGDSSLTDAGAVQAGLVTLLLPAVPPGAERGLAAALRLLGHTDAPGGAEQRLR
ncbi:MAG: haloacid dehalogenase [Candidatus Nephthysia bennettiae]|uniref:HAD family hydrolase n=1 Tax=Candidatus Nephthysia bennettiae TaxID=3127016 RepID=A0A934KDZ9_9BACT|nr:HAD family hydrolase [Candidatus Dormibacteraeota bacterium]MBJ7613708.1 HAD family hydrolase [Candidatus Dormibacteraeota bacterium]PZR94940.1 MAG: haloacid dehalogenase [Candidatus Dormibacteraeota bacterium]